MTIKEFLSKACCFSSLLILLAVKAIAVIWYISQGWVQLYPDEAQYWLWSRLLDIGYYSKPPGVAWAIYLTTKFWAHTELGVRLSAVILSTILTIALYILCLQTTKKDRLSFWSAVAFTLSPLGILSSFLATTDVGAITFMTISWIFWINTFKSKYHLYPVLAGVSLAIAALFKWIAFIQLGVMALSWFIIQPKRWRDMLIFLAIPFMALIPSLIWNMQHDFPTFRHVASQVADHQLGNASKAGNPIEFFFAQIFLLSPGVFIILFCAARYVRARFSAQSSIIKVWLIYGSGMFLGYLVLACIKKLQGNWAVYIYPPLFAFIPIYYSEESKPNLYALKSAIFFSLFLVGTLFMIAPYQRSSYQITYPLNIPIFKHTSGWDMMDVALSSAGYEPSHHFLATPSYQLSSLASFYAPEQKRAYMLNIYGLRHNQFDYWPSILDSDYSSGYFIFDAYLPEGLDVIEINSLKYEQLIQPYFQRIEFVTAFPLTRPIRGKVKWLYIYFCQRPLENPITSIKSNAY